MIDDHGPSPVVAAAPDWAILVVDDDAAKRLALRVMLAPLGHPVVEADSGRAALRAVTHQRFAVILMDVRMPTLDGLETAKLMRQRPEAARTPIIFVTGFERDEVQTAAAYAGGAVDFIFAPILPHVLHAKVTAFVDLFVQAEELRRSLESVSALNAALRESEERARAVLLNVADGIVTSSEDGRIESINRSARRMFDYREEELVGEPMSRIVGSDIAGEPTEMVGLRKDGSTFPMELEMSATRIGEQTFTISCIRDISARKLAEAEKADLEAQLRETHKMEAIGRLAGGIAHDFNSLLTVIGGYTDELATRLDEQPALEAVAEEIRHAADRAIALTAQLLTFGRRQRLELRTLDLNAVIANIEPMLHRLSGDDVVLITAARPRTPARHSRPESDRPGPHEPRRQRPRRDAHRRHTHDPDLQPGRQHDQRRPSARKHARARTFRDPLRDRHRRRPRRADPLTDLRSLLHDQSDRQGNRAGTRDRLRHRPPERRSHPGLLHTRPRCHVPVLAPGRRRRPRTPPRTRDRAR